MYFLRVSQIAVIQSGDVAYETQSDERRIAQPRHASGKSSCTANGDAWNERFIVMSDSDGDINGVKLPCLRTVRRSRFWRRNYLHRQQTHSWSPTETC